MITISKTNGRVAVSKPFIDETITGNTAAVDHDAAKITISHDGGEVSTVDLAGYDLLIFAGGLDKSTNGHVVIWTVKQ